MNSYDLSIIIPINNEELNIPLLAKEIEAELMDLFKFEVIWVDDGSEDSSWLQIQRLGGVNRGIKLYKNYGQSSAMMAGVLNAKGELILTMDGDLQSDPKDIKKMLEAFSKDVDLVQGYRVNRNDRMLSRKIPSYLANKLAKKILPESLIDLGCTLRLFRSTLMDSNKLMGEMHRVFGLYLITNGANFIEIPVNHRPRISGKSKYGLNRTYKFLADIILLKFMSTIVNKPLYLFFRLSIVTLFSSILLLVLAFALRIFNIKDYIDSVFIVGSMILFSTAVLLLSLGLISEILSRVYLSLSPKAQFTIRAKIGYE
jgi:glycosyltransferase involved in cell wall biosynthesis